MEVWLVSGAVAFFSWCGFLFWAGYRVGSAPLPAVEAELRFTKERLESARLALANEVKDARERARGARSDFEKDRALRDALRDPDPGSRLERVLHSFPAAEGTAASGESTGEAD